MLPPTCLSERSLLPSPKTRPTSYGPSPGPPIGNTAPGRIAPVLNRGHLHQPSRKQPNHPLLRLADPVRSLPVDHIHLRVPGILPTSHSIPNLSSRKGASILVTVSSLQLAHPPRRHLPRGQCCGTLTSRRKSAPLFIMMVTITSLFNQFH